MIRALLFDLDDTLLDHTGAARDAVDQWCRELGLPQGQHARFTAIEHKWFSAYAVSYTHLTLPTSDLV